MAIKIEFDSNHNAMPATLVLANRAGQKLGVLNTTVSFNLTDNMNSYSQFTVDVYKQFNGSVCDLWDSVVPLKLVWCKQWDKWFEIDVQVDEQDDTVKHVTGTSLGEAQLGQIMLYDIQINTQADILREDYTKPTVLYDQDDPSASLLNRIMEKAPHYRISHVDYTIADIQRTFQFDGISIYDAMQQIAAEIGCIFIFQSGSTQTGKIDRTVAVYDLQSYCLDCDYRGDFIEKCPECGSQNITTGYGDDTAIFVSTENLADNITFTTDVGSVKNCFRLVAGDQLMTATIANCNPNGSNYIWYISDDMKKDMPSDLVEKLESYDDLYNMYQNTYEIQVSQQLRTKYNAVVANANLTQQEAQAKTIPEQIVGYPALMQYIYEVVDLYYYLQSSMMPSHETAETSAEQQAALLTSEALSPVSVTDASNISLATANSAVLAMAKCIVASGYQVKVNQSQMTGTTTWQGSFTVTSYYDEQDTAISATISVQITDDYENYVKQMLQKSLTKDDTQDVSISGLFNKDYDDFCIALKQYCLDQLNRFNESCQSCLDILIDQGIADKDAYKGLTPNLYEQVYYKYYQKKKAIEAEMTLRSNQINTVSQMQDLLQQNVSSIQNALDFQDYLGVDLWELFCAYTREDTFENQNYISDGLSNAELFDNARKFLSVAQKEIVRSAQLQHSITASMKNLLLMKQFEPLYDSFQIGNWIRIMIDDKVYRLRLLQYSIDFDSDTLQVSFSDVSHAIDWASDIESVLQSAVSMATSYGHVSRQAEKGYASKEQINNWYDNGMALTNMKIVTSADNQNMIMDSHGLLMKQYLPITQEFSPEQLKVINKGIYITDDDWETSRAGIGHFKYYDPQTGEQKDGYGVIADTLVGDLILSEEVGVYNESGSISLNQDGLVIQSYAQPGDKQTVFKIRRNYTDQLGVEQVKDIFYIDSDGQLVLDGSVRISSSTTTGNGQPIDKTVAAVVVQYYLSDSQYILSGGEWSAVAPQWTEGKYMWQRAVTTYVDGSSSVGEATCISGATGEDGQDAVLLRIDSSRGTVFKNNNVSTVLSVTIFYGEKCIIDKAGLTQAFGINAYLQWKWRRLNDDNFGTISSSDSRIKNDGFEFHLSPQDVDTKVTFQCDLIV